MSRQNRVRNKGTKNFVNKKVTKNDWSIEALTLAASSWSNSEVKPIADHPAVKHKHKHIRQHPQKKKFDALERLKKLSNAKEGYTVVNGKLVSVKDAGVQLRRTNALLEIKKLNEFTQNKLTQLDSRINGSAKNTKKKRSNGRS